MRCISREDVIRLFLRYEAGKGRFTNMADEILSWCELPDLKMIEKAKEFAASRTDLPPVWIYTGCYPENDRSGRVDFWVKEKVPCEEIFTNGIGRHMATDLETVNGNMKLFALNYAENYQEFKSFRNIPNDRQIMILVKKQREGKNGTYELIDGSHRLVGMIIEGKQSVPAYVAYLK